MTAKKAMNVSPVIALLTDFSWSSWYLGVMKGVILGLNPAARIIDLCHNVSSQDVREGSFVLENSYTFFPSGTIFLCVVDPGVGGERKNIIVETNKYRFVAPDNGILSAVFEKGQVRRVFEVRPGKHTLKLQGSTFLGRDVFAPIATHLSLGVPPEEMGDQLESVLTVPSVKPVLDADNDITGKAVYVDTFGNIITNISEDYLRSVCGEDVPFENLSIRMGKRRLTGINRYYEEGKVGKLMALIDSWGYLEIAVNRGNAFRELGLTDKRSFSIKIPCREQTGKG